VKAAISLARLHYSLPFSFTFALTVVYAAGGSLDGIRRGLALSTAAFALVLAGAYALNDAADADGDHLTAPWRPIPSGRIGRGAAALFGAVLIASGLTVAALGRPLFLAALAGLAAGLVAYDLGSKRIGPWKAVAVAALTASIYPLALAQAGGAWGRRAWTLAAFPAWLFLTSFGYEVLKDLRDHEEALLRRPRLWRGASSAAILAGAALLAVPRLLGCGDVYLSIVLLAMAAAAAVPFLSIRGALAAAYAECVLVGIAATADLYSVVKP
jgi:geranylgeranylglycerol-phosphate geranylgeranyltransferase